jgi:hypothetical protein
MVNTLGGVVPLAAADCEMMTVRKKNKNEKKEVARLHMGEGMHIPRTIGPNSAAHQITEVHGHFRRSRIALVSFRVSMFSSTNHTSAKLKTRPIRLKAAGNFAFSS